MMDVICTHYSYIVKEEQPPFLHCIVPLQLYREKDTYLLSNAGHPGRHCRRSNAHLWAVVVIPNN